MAEYYSKLTDISSALRLISGKTISLYFLSIIHNTSITDNLIISQEQKENIHQVFEIQY